LDTTLPEDRIVVHEAGQSTLWVVDGIRAFHPRYRIWNQDFAALGLGMPMAMGAAVATDRTSVAFCGDAGFFMSLQELDTAVREQIPVVVIVLNDEALRAVLHEELAVTEASEILGRIQTGEITVETVGERTPIGRGGRSGGQELLAPENADASVIQTVRERIQNDRVILFCLHCQEYERTKQVKRVRDQPECPECGSTRIAALNPWDEETVAAALDYDGPSVIDFHIDPEENVFPMVPSGGENGRFALQEEHLEQLG
jgi:hypothetical protein